MTHLDANAIAIGVVVIAVVKVVALLVGKSN